ncbi:hypothetical protein [Longirhabdus pacifica]|nr:hypothetical protein [Longirhabdus pacifica]
MKKILLSIMLTALLIASFSGFLGQNVHASQGDEGHVMLYTYNVGE